MVKPKSLLPSGPMLCQAWKSYARQCCPAQAPIYYTWKNITKQCKINKLKIIAPMQNGRMMSLIWIQMVLLLFIKKYEKWTITPIHVYINGINNRLVQLTLNKGAGCASLTIFVTLIVVKFLMFYPVTNGGGLYYMTLCAI